MAENANLFTLKVKTLNGKVLELKISPTCTIPALKVYITENSGTPASEQTLIFQGKVLKDDKTVSDYSLKEGSTIHLVKKKIEQNPQQTPSTAQQPQQPSPSQNQNVSFGPNVVMGTITLPDGSGSAPPSLNQIIGSVFNSFGVPNPIQGNVASQTPSSTNQGDGFTLLRGNLDALHNNISQLNNQTSTTSQTNATNTNNNSSANTGSSSSSHCEIIGQSLSRINSNWNQVAPSINQLSSLLQSESTLTDGAARQEAQRLANQVGPLFHQLGHVLLCVGSSLQSLRMGDTPGSAQVPPPQRPILASATVAASMTGTPVSSDGRQAPGIQPAQLRVPLFTVTPGPGVAPQQPISSFLNATASSSQNPTNSSSENASAVQNPPQNPARVNSTSNTQQPLPSPSVGQTNSNVNTSTTPSPPAPFASLMSQLFSSVAQTFPPSTSSSSPNSQGQDFGSLITQLMGGMQSLSSDNNAPVNQRQPNETPTYNMNDVVSSISQDLDLNSPSEESDVLNSMFSRVLETLSVTDIVGVMNGQLEPLQKIHPVLQNYLKELLKGDESPNSFARVINDIVESFRPSFQETVSAPQIKDKIRPGYDLPMIASHIVRKHSSTVLKLIHKNYAVSSSNPYPFALAIKDWNALFVDDLVYQLAIGMKGGIPDVIELFKTFLSKSLSFMGNDFSQSATTILTSSLMSSYNQIQDLSDFQNRSNWKRVMDLDEIRQGYSGPQTPFSDAYLNGGPSKKRKIDVISVENIFRESIQDNLRETNLQPQDGSVTSQASKELFSSFSKKLKKDLAAKLQKDKDFQQIQSRYPLASKLKEKHHSN